MKMCYSDFNICRNNRNRIRFHNNSKCTHVRIKNLWKLSRETIYSSTIKYSFFLLKRCRHDIHFFEMEINSKTASLYYQSFCYSFWNIWIHVTVSFWNQNRRTLLVSWNELYWTEMCIIRKSYSNVSIIHKRTWKLKGKHVQNYY